MGLKCLGLVWYGLAWPGWVNRKWSELKKNEPYDEDLGAAQFPEDTSISCKKLSIVVKSC